MVDLTRSYRRRSSWRRATAVTTSAWAKERFGSGAIYMGLVYPVAVCLLTVLVGGLFIRETKDHRIDGDAHPMSD